MSSAPPPSPRRFTRPSASLSWRETMPPRGARSGRCPRHLHVQAGAERSALGRRHRARRRRGNRREPDARNRGRRWPEDRRRSRALPFEGDGDRCHPAARPSRILTPSSRTGTSWNGTNTSTCRWAPAWPSPTWRAAARSPVPSARSGSSGATTACAIPKKVVDEIENLVNDHDVGFFILADEEPTINRKKFIEFCEELIARGLPDKIKWGINTRVTDIMRDKELLPLYRKAGLVHVSLGTEAAAQMKLDQFNKETKVDDNKEAIRLLREADIFVEAQFIVGLDNETPETLEETYQMAWDWQPDLANWAMYTPWPFTPLFQELRDQVEVFDFSKYNFVTPIMKPESDGPGDAARPGDEQLPALLHEARRCSITPGAAPASAAATCWAASRPSSRRASSAHLLRPGQGGLLGPAIQGQGGLPLRPRSGANAFESAPRKRLKTSLSERHFKKRLDLCRLRTFRNRRTHTPHLYPERQPADRRRTRRSPDLPLAYGCFRAVVSGADRPACPCYRDKMRGLRGGRLPV
jgi:hypothetical protein